MKKTKVENISSVKLEFFLKQNKADIRVALSPGESSWCDNGTTTKSMILYNRKNLIKVYDDTTVEKYIDTNNDEVLDKLHTTEDIRTVALDIVPPKSMTPPDAEFMAKTTFDSVENKATPSISDIDDIKYLQDNLFKSLKIPKSFLEEISIIEKATKETEEYNSESAKTYKGKKRGRKKKRGPKTGSKKNKPNSGTTIIGTTEN